MDLTEARIDSKLSNDFYMFNVKSVLCNAAGLGWLSYATLFLSERGRF